MQVSAYLRETLNGHVHWCPGCEETHLIPKSWTFDGNFDSPTFNPSVKITGKQTVVKDGQWTGEWVFGPDGKPLDLCCHYFLHAGELKFCGDSTHAFSGQNVKLSPLPSWDKDDA